MEEPGAEQEADRLSRDITSRTPDTLMREMGGRLGADLSSVRFHSDSASLSKSRAMGARAWTQGHDVYFGRGGFEPSVAAHELVHTVQQGAVRGNVSRSVPLGTVQLLPDDDDENRIRNEDIHDQDARQDQAQGNAESNAVTAIEDNLMRYFVTEDGAKLFLDFEGKLRSIINKKLGKKEDWYHAAGAIRFFVRACYRDYALRDILQHVISNPVETKDDRKSRGREYNALVGELSSRLTPADTEELAIETGLYDGIPRFDHSQNRKSTRAYDVQAGNGGLVSFNPNNVPELGRVQAAIDAAGTPEQAYNIFAAYTGNPGGRYNDDFKSMKVDMNLFRSKLKNMARVVTDYPELKHMIGSMDVIDPNSDTLMSTIGTRGGSRAAQFEYNKILDREGADADLERAAEDQRNEQDHFHISPREYHGTHELGHALASLLVENTGRRMTYTDNYSLKDRITHRSLGWEAPAPRGGNGHTLSNQIDEETYELPENDMLENVLGKNDFRMMRQHGINKVKPFNQDRDLNGHHFLKGQIDTRKLEPLGMTSKYGSLSAGEMFGEAIADVYSHGSGAKEMSKELVKEYESRQKRIAIKRFNKNKKSWWQRLFGW